MRTKKNILVVFWLLAFGMAFGKHYFDNREYHTNLAFQSARAFLEQIVVARSWNAGHGGVYVQETEKNPPNPYLDDPLRDIETRQGLKLTKVNPAYMTRQISELAAQRNGVRFHITSLNPIRPENKALDWEAEWLESFEKGAREHGEFVGKGSTAVFRYMAPLVVEKNCLHCHAKQGYREGDIRGGISVVMPFPTGESLLYPATFYGGLALLGWLIIYILGGMVEARDRRQQELIYSIDESRKEYESIMNKMFSGFAVHEMVYDGDGQPVDYRFLFVNPAFEKLTGLKIEDLVGRRVKEVLPGTEQYWIDTYGKVAMTGEPISFENYSSDLDRYFLVSAFRPAAGRFACIFQDVTFRVRAEKEREKLESQLRQAEKMEAIGVLAGGIAHDFNNILAAIIGYAEIIRDEASDNKQIREDVDRILQSSTRAANLVKQILSFSRKADLDFRPVEFHLVVEETLALLRSSIPTTVEIRANLDPQSGLVLVDPTKIHQVIMNLCSNAVYAMAEKGVIGVRLARVELADGDLPVDRDLLPGPYVRLTVEDNGSGMDKETMQSIFSPFFTTKELGQGTGMGLSVVHGIVEGHRGFITVESEPGKGSVFKVFFPVVATSANGTENRKQPDTVIGGEEKILFVDDEESLIEMATRILRSLGYHVVSFSSSVEALDAFKSSPDGFDLVITDQAMPELSGSELTAEVLKIRPGMPVILCTGYSSKVSEGDFRSHGISGFLMKPYEKNMLGGMVRKVLNGKA